MFGVLKESGDRVAAFCFGEAALRLLPNDSDFRFQLAYAYDEGASGSGEHDYQDLALAHYKLLASDNSASEYSLNNLGVVFNHFEAPINATEQFKAASTRGNALATANVIRQYVRAGFLEDAKAWAEAHKPSSDDKGEMVQALAALHPARNAETEKIEKVTAYELTHRAALANFATSNFFSAPTAVDGEYRFPIASLKISQNGDAIVGLGANEGFPAKMLHRLSGTNRNNLWRFKIESKKEGEYFLSDSSNSFGLLKFTPDGNGVSVLEYHGDGRISSYVAMRTSPPPQVELPHASMLNGKEDAT